MGKPARTTQASEAERGGEFPETAEVAEEAEVEGSGEMTVALVAIAVGFPLLAFLYRWIVSLAINSQGRGQARPVLLEMSAFSAESYADEIRPDEAYNARWFNRMQMWLRVGAFAFAGVIALIHLYSQWMSLRIELTSMSGGN